MKNKHKKKKRQQQKNEMFFFFLLLYSFIQRKVLSSVLKTIAELYIDVYIYAMNVYMCMYIEYTQT